MDATEQFAAFALMGLLANGSHHPKTVVDRAWELGRDMELKAMEHRRLLSEKWARETRERPEPTAIPGGEK